jgi:hypothetical protein
MQRSSNTVIQVMNATFYPHDPSSRMLPVKRSEFVWRTPFCFECVGVSVRPTSRPLQSYTHFTLCVAITDCTNVVCWCTIRRYCYGTICRSSTLASSPYGRTKQVSKTPHISKVQIMNTPSEPARMRSRVDSSTLLLLLFRNASNKCYLVLQQTFDNVKILGSTYALAVWSSASSCRHPRYQAGLLPSNAFMMSRCIDVKVYVSVCTYMDMLKSIE